MASMRRASPNKGCGVCKSRKIRCDRVQPSCTQCARSGRVCDGYGLHLSWPRPGDKKRTILGPNPGRKTRCRRRKDLLWINTSIWDLELHEALLNGSLLTTEEIWNPRIGTARFNSMAYHPGPSHPQYKRLDWIPFGLSHDQMDLLRYYHFVAFSVLATFGNNQVKLRDLMMRMSFSENTLSSNAVLQAILALAAVHRGGDLKEATSLKVAAIRALRMSMAAGPMNNKQAMQHVASGMLLCTLEISRPSETYGDWIRYGCGAKQVIQASKITTSVGDEDTLHLLRLVHYHDVLARFSIRHWRREQIGADCRFNSADRQIQSYVCQDPKTLFPSSGSHQILHLLSSLCDTIVDPSDPQHNSEQYRNRLRRIQKQLQKPEWPGVSTSISSSSLAESDEMAMVTELHRLAVLTYLERATGYSSRDSFEVETLASKAFAIFTELKTCRWLFPLFIFGSEARTEGRRRIILEITERTASDPAVRSLNCIRAIIEAIWAQDDLADREELEYIKKVRAVLSSSVELPVFV